MAVTHNNANFGTLGLAPDVTLTFDVVVFAGSNILGLIGVAWQSLGVSSLDTVTVNGVAATFLQFNQDFVDDIHQFYIKNLVPGLNTVVVTWSGDNVVAVGGIVVLNGVDLVSPIGVFGVSGTSSIGPATKTLVGTTADSMVVETSALEGGSFISAMGKAHAERTGRNTRPPTHCRRL